jgi:prepilin peptidase dependent protein B
MGTSPASDADQTGFRLQNGVLETLRGATSCEGKGWDKMTDPNTVVSPCLR